MSTSPFSLFCIGNPLLDIQVRDGEKLLEKYGLKANDAILANDEHMPMWGTPFGETSCFLSSDIFSTL